MDCTFMSLWCLTRHQNGEAAEIYQVLIVLGNKGHESALDRKKGKERLKS